MLQLLDKETLTEEEINQLIELNVEESINLDFKRAESLGKEPKRKAEIAKDVSAFANSAGGFIIYGIDEKNHVADSLSFINGNEYTKEWIEQVIQTRIQKKIDGLIILPIRFENDISKSIYVIKIPESPLAPHMTSDKRFYKRYNFESVQMEEYEIRNLYNRKEKTKLKIDGFSVGEPANTNQKPQDNEGYIYFNLAFQVENIGKAIERDYKIIASFNFSGHRILYDKLVKTPPTITYNKERIYSFSNDSPIFPDELYSLGNIDFGIYFSKLEHISKTGKIKIKLLYTNGTDEQEFDMTNFNDIYKESLQLIKQIIS